MGSLNFWPTLNELGPSSNSKAGNPNSNKMHVYKNGTQIYFHVSIDNLFNLGLQDGPRLTNVGQDMFMKIVEDESECFASLGILFINTHGLIENMKRNMKEQNKETLCNA